jgi:hypothetical protein
VAFLHSRCNGYIGILFSFGIRERHFFILGAMVMPGALPSLLKLVEYSHTRFNGYLVMTRSFRNGLSSILGVIVMPSCVFLWELRKGISSALGLIVVVP